MAKDNESVQAHFNRVAEDLEGSSYEERRWVGNDRVKAQYEAAHSFMNRYVVPNLSDREVIVELGPGPGTWTKMLAAHAPRARFVLTDIAIGMLERAKTVIPSEQSVETREGDFLTVSLDGIDADYFFSSRAIEYVSDKKAAAQRVANLLRTGGEGCIITKMPKPIANKLTGRKPSSLHQGQITPALFAQHLKASGLADIRLYPVTFGVPMLNSAKADQVVSKMFGALPLNPASALFAESYAVLFRKP